MVVVIGPGVDVYTTGVGVEQITVQDVVGHAEPIQQVWTGQAVVVGVWIG